MGKYRTAQGKVIDMNALSAKNERTRAVGNMKVNARGDTIDGSGRVTQPVTQKVTDAYSKTVGNKSARVSRKPERSAKQPENRIQEPEVSETELEELNAFDIDADEIEQIKAVEKETRASQAKSKEPKRK